MTPKLWALLGVLAGWAGVVSWRRRKDEQDVDRVRTPQSPSGAQAGGAQADDDIDHDELEQAEREVRDMDQDPRGRPLDDGAGDDWGPGTPKPPFV